MERAAAMLTISAFAARIGVTPRRARALAAAGRIPGAVKLGRDWLIPEAAEATPGARGPSSRASRSHATQVVAARAGQVRALKRRRQRRFLKAAAGSGPAIRAAVVFRLPPESLFFEEPELTPDDLP
jgi:hypothetical protein